MLRVSAHTSRYIRLIKLSFKFCSGNLKDRCGKILHPAPPPDGRRDLGEGGGCIMRGILSVTMRIKLELSFSSLFSLEAVNRWLIITVLQESNVLRLRFSCAIWQFIRCPLVVWLVFSECFETCGWKCFLKSERQIHFFC